MCGINQAMAAQGNTLGVRETVQSFVERQATNSERYAKAMRYLQTCLKVYPPADDVEQELWSIVGNVPRRY